MPKSDKGALASTFEIDFQKSIFSALTETPKLHYVIYERNTEPRKMLIFCCWTWKQTNSNMSSQIRQISQLDFLQDALVSCCLGLVSLQLYLGVTSQDKYWGRCYWRQIRKKASNQYIYVLFLIHLHYDPSISCRWAEMVTSGPTNHIESFI